jgi:hypothetical protein
LGKRRPNAASLKSVGLLSIHSDMTPEKRARLRELPALIANEKDAEKVKLLAGLERLLSVEHNPWLSSKRKPRSS